MRNSWLLLAGLQFCTVASAQTMIRADQKYIESIRRNSEISAVSVDGFGEKIDLASGSVQFSWTDIDIPGNNALPVRLQRVLVIEDKSRSGGELGGFGPAGDIDIPYLRGVHVNGWQVSGTSPNARCSLAANSPPAFGVISASDYWSGNWLHIPWEGDQAMLSKPAPSLPKPNADTPLMTKSFWAFSCLPSTKNGHPGEAFVALSPNGEKYYFDWGVSKPYSPLSKRYGNYAHATQSVTRQMVYFFVTHIEDRFGNWVKYDYIGEKLSQITSSDGRFIRVSGWSGNNITSVSSSIGNWSYGYTSNSFTVTQPDAAQLKLAWTGELRVEPTPNLPLYEGSRRCPLPEPSSGAYALAITLPSGATASYEFEVDRHFTNNIPEMCNSFTDEGLQSYKYLTIPNFNDALTLTKKTVTGPGLQPMQWTYAYAGGGPFAFEAMCSNPPTPYACVPTKQTVVRGPDRTYRAYTFGNMYKINAGQLLRVDEGTESGTAPDTQVEISRSTENVYVSTEQAAAQAFPSQVGSAGSSRFDEIGRASLRPLLRKTVFQDGTAFTWEVAQACSVSFSQCFDVFGRPTKVVHASAPAP